MLAEDSVRLGRLEEALSQLQDQVRLHPANPQYRVFLFQLLCVLGQWERALTQLKVAGDLDAGTLAMVQTYQEALRCEMSRSQVFSGRRSPLLFGKPEEWMALLLEAARLTGQGKADEGDRLRARALESAPGTKGSIDGQAFEWIADADSRLGPMLEAIVNGRYYWVPFRRLRTIRVEKPVDLRDVAWLPAYFTLANGGETVALIPTRYPGSEASGDAQIRMARRTEWRQEGETYIGLGQRLLATDQGEYPLMDVRTIALETEPETDVKDEHG